MLSVVCYTSKTRSLVTNFGFFEKGKKRIVLLLYISILTFQHISHGYEEHKVSATYFLSLFSFSMGQEKNLTDSMHGRILSPTSKERFYVDFSICTYIIFSMIKQLRFDKHHQLRNYISFHKKFQPCLLKLHPYRNRYEELQELVGNGSLTFQLFQMVKIYFLSF